MRHLITILAILFTLTAQAQDTTIVGKWKCPQAFLHQLGLRYPGMRGHYEFKKDGTFTLRIDGRSKPYQRRRAVLPGVKYPKLKPQRPVLYLKVKGSYTVADGKITTTVAAKDIKCNVDSGEAPLYFEYPQDDFHQRVYDMDERRYNDRNYMAGTQEDVIKNEYTYLWTWNDEPLTVTDKGFVVGNKVDMIDRGMPVWEGHVIDTTQQVTAMPSQKYYSYRHRTVESDGAIADTLIGTQNFYMADIWLKDGDKEYTFGKGNRHHAAIIKRYGSCIFVNGKTKLDLLTNIHGWNIYGTSSSKEQLVAINDRCGVVFVEMADDKGTIKVKPGVRGFKRNASRYLSTLDKDENKNTATVEQMPWHYVAVAAIRDLHDLKDALRLLYT